MVVVGEMSADLKRGNGSEDGGGAEAAERAPTLTVANASEPAVAANPMYFQRVASLAACAASPLICLTIGRAAVAIRDNMSAIGMQQ